MNTNHIKGAVETLSGKAKVAVGTVFESNSLVVEGKVDQIKGAAHTTLGNMKDGASDLHANLAGKISQFKR